jgi:hypothetical protein
MEFLLLAAAAAFCVAAFKIKRRKRERYHNGIYYWR